MTSVTRWKMKLLSDYTTVATEFFGEIVLCATSIDLRYLLDFTK